MTRHLTHNAVPLLDITRQLRPIRKQIDNAIADVVDRACFIMGSDVDDFEKMMAEYCCVKHAVGCASGSDALLLALLAAGVQEGDTVITTAYSFYATAGAICHVGAQPVFIDIDPETMNMDTKLLAKAIRTDTSAILPVHLFGQMCNMTEIMNVAGDIPVIEDAAQAVGARWKNKFAGQFGAAACFSFFPSKNLGAFGDGGMIVTNSDEIAASCRSLRVHGSNKTYFHKVAGYNSRLDTIQAAVLKVKLKYLDRWNRQRQANAEYYDRAFAGTRVKTPVISNEAESVFNQYSIRVANRDEVRETLRKNKIGHAVYYPIPLPFQPCFAELGYRPGDFPAAELSAEQSLAIPVFSELTVAEQKIIIDVILNTV